MNAPRHYLLEEDGTVTALTGPDAWRQWAEVFSREDGGLRRIGRDFVRPPVNGASIATLEKREGYGGRKGRSAARRLRACFYVSTVFLGLDHSFGFGDPPILFETMVFTGGTYDGLYQDRYATLEEARVGHALTCLRFQGQLVSPGPAGVS